MKKIKKYFNFLKNKSINQIKRREKMKIFSNELAIAISYQHI